MQEKLHHGSCFPRVGWYNIPRKDRPSRADGCVQEEHDVLEHASGSHGTSE